MRQKMLSEALKERFGTKVYKLSMTSGCTCPNRDGGLKNLTADPESTAGKAAGNDEKSGTGYGGCTFCSEGGSGEFAAPFLPPEEQIRLARQRVDAKFPARIPVSERRYIAYFQSFTNTYARNREELERLRRLYTETIRRPGLLKYWKCSGNSRRPNRQNRSGWNWACRPFMSGLQRGSTAATAFRSLKKLSGI